MATLVSSDLLEEVVASASEYGISFTKHDKGVCYNCDEPAILYTPDFKVQQFNITEPTCSLCISIMLKNILSSFVFELLDDAEGLMIQGGSALITKVAAIALQDETLCPACYRVFIPFHESYGVAVALDIDRAERDVHKRCANIGWDCTNCDNHYYSSSVALRYTTHHNIYYGMLPANMGHYELEGDLTCRFCFDEINESERIVFCDSCETYAYYSNSRGWNGDVYCQPCYDEYIYYCEDCNENYHINRGHDCSYDDDDDNNSPIHNYSYKPAPEFFGQGKYYLGFELEVESRNESRYDGAAIAESILGHHAYMKDDGSLNDGFEIVTHPHTLEAYENFKWEILSALKSRGYRSWNTNTCGLHVHVSRTAFDPVRIPNTRRERVLRRQAHELRFMKLIYDNQRQVERIAGRSNCHYSSFDDKNNLVPKVKNGYQSNGRYAAVNTENHETLEVRVFRGSLRPERVRSALEFVHAAVEYTRDLKVSGKNNALTWSKFLAYVVTNENIYPNLLTIINETLARENAVDGSND